MERRFTLSIRNILLCCVTKANRTQPRLRDLATGTKNIQSMGFHADRSLPSICKLQGALRCLVTCRQVLRRARNIPSQSLARMSWFAFGCPSSSHILSAILKLLSVDDLPWPTPSQWTIWSSATRTFQNAVANTELRRSNWAKTQTVMQMPEGQVVGMLQI